VALVIEGVDFSDSRPGGAALAAAGKAFVVRYIPYGGLTKGLTAAEVADYHAHGIAICLVWELTANRALAGSPAGATDATTSKNAAAVLGFPATTPIYFAVDFDATAGQQLSIDAYLRGAASVLGAARVGVYGGLHVIQRCQASKTAAWFWQTYAWSGGVVAPGIHLLQYLNSQHINGASVDFCRAYQPNYGGWLSTTQGGPNQPGDEMAFATDPNPKLIDVPAGQPQFELDGKTVFSQTTAHTGAYSPYGLGSVLRAFLISYSAGQYKLVLAVPSKIYEPDCTAAVKAATDPLTAKIAAAKVALG